MLAGTSGQAASMFILRTEGTGSCPHSKNSKISSLFFYPSKIMCVNQAWWPVPVIPSLRRRRQARPCLREKSGFHKADLSLQTSSFLCPCTSGRSWPPSHFLLPLTYLLRSNTDFAMSGTLNRDTHKENDGQFPVLPHVVIS